MGYRFRLHRDDLPGRPDIVLPRFKAVVFVHGCFWRQHPGCHKSKPPATRRDFWLPKLARTVERDRENAAELAEQGWRPIIVWECELKDAASLVARLDHELRRKPHSR